MDVDTQTVTSEAKNTWESDPKTRADFDGNFDRFLAYRLAAARGGVRVAHHEVAGDGQVRPRSGVLR